LEGAIPLHLLLARGISTPSKNTVRGVEKRRTGKDPRAGPLGKVRKAETDWNSREPSRKGQF